MARPRQRRIPLVEWVAGLVSAVIVAVTVGYLAYEAFQPNPGPPALVVTVVGTREAAGSWIVDVEIRNDSREAAADVHLAGSARASDGRDARPEARVDYVPGFSTRHASLVFAVDPGATPEVRVVGYTRP
jgi:uncharacterized protein (TIGR02588 family)